MLDNKERAKKRAKKGRALKVEETKYATAGLILSIFRSTSKDATPTPQGEKEYEDESNEILCDMKSKNILKLRSLPYTAHCEWVIFKTNFQNPKFIYAHL